MLHYLALTLPGGQSISAPAGVPTGGLTYANTVIGNAVTLMITFAIVLCLIFLTWGGVQWVQSAGDKAKLSAARAKLTWAIIGLIIVFVAFFIINIVGYFFNVPLLGK